MKLKLFNVFTNSCSGEENMIDSSLLSPWNGLVLKQRIKSLWQYEWRQMVRMNSVYSQSSCTQIFGVWLKPPIGCCKHTITILLPHTGTCAYKQRHAFEYKHASIHPLIQEGTWRDHTHDWGASTLSGSFYIPKVARRRHQGKTSWNAASHSRDTKPPGREEPELQNTHVLLNCSCSPPTQGSLLLSAHISISPLITKWDSVWMIHSPQKSFLLFELKDVASLGCLISKM